MEEIVLIRRSLKRFCAAVETSANALHSERFMRAFVVERPHESVEVRLLLQAV